MAFGSPNHGIRSDRELGDNFSYCMRRAAISRRSRLLRSRLSDKVVAIIFDGRSVLSTSAPGIGGSKKPQNHAADGKQSAKNRSQSLADFLHESHPRYRLQQVRISTQALRDSGHFELSNLESDLKIEHELRLRISISELGLRMSRPSLKREFHDLRTCSSRKAIAGFYKAQLMTLRNHFACRRRASCSKLK